MHAHTFRFVCIRHTSHLKQRLRTSTLFQRRHHLFRWGYDAMLLYETVSCYSLGLHWEHLLETRIDWHPSITRRPATTGIYILLKIPSKRKKTFFFLKKFFPHIFSNFSKFHIFWLLNKKLTIKKEMAFLKKNKNWYAFYNKFATFTDFDKKFKFFSTAPPPSILYVFEKSLRQSCCNFVMKNFQNQAVRK